MRPVARKHERRRLRRLLLSGCGLLFFAHVLVFWSVVVVREGFAVYILVAAVALPIALIGFRRILRSHAGLADFP